MPAAPRERSRSRNFTRSRYSRSPRRGRSLRRSRSYSRSASYSSYSRSRSWSSYSSSSRYSSYSRYSRSPRRSPSRDRAASKPVIKTALLSNLTRNCTKAHIREIVSLFGKPLLIEFPVDSTKKVLQARIEFFSLDDAEDCIEALDQGVIDGSTVSLKMLTADQMADLVHKSLAAVMKSPKKPVYSRLDRFRDRS